MNFKTKVFGLVVWTAAFAASAANWYVDAVNGNDSWDGTTPVVPVEGTAGPRKTLAAAMPLAGVGDTVYAAPGTYDQGEMWDAQCGVSNRVVVACGRRLVATAGRKRTFIKGKKSNEISTGFGPDSVRCVLLHGKGAIVVPTGFITAKSSIGARFSNTLWTSTLFMVAFRCRPMCLRQPARTCPSSSSTIPARRKRSC